MQTATMPCQKIITKIEANPALVSRKNSNKPLNVAAYCRVSTDAEDQINSYHAQVSYYTEHIMQNPKWRFVKVYADEGITGTMVKKRDHFLEMIEDCEKGKIDMILTKSVSRFARNIVDSISYVRKLKAMGISIYFEEQNIDSLKEDSETYIGIYSVMAQSESENISMNVKWGMDLDSEHERYITEQVVKGPVFLTDYPKDIKAFYMRQNDDGKTVAACDLLVPGVGELVGGSQREERVDYLIKRMDELKMDKSVFAIDVMLTSAFVGLKPSMEVIASPDFSGLASSNVIVSPT